MLVRDRKLAVTLLHLCMWCVVGDDRSAGGDAGTMLLSAGSSDEPTLRSWPPKSSACITDDPALRPWPPKSLPGIMLCALRPFLILVAKNFYSPYN